MAMETTVAVYFDERGEFAGIYQTPGVRVLCISEAAPDDRVYRMDGIDETNAVLWRKRHRRRLRHNTGRMPSSA